MSVLVEHQGAPDRTLAQRFKALDRANAVRLGMADVKRELAAGLPLAEGLEDERAQAAKIGDLLLAVPKIGPVRVRALLGELKISEHRRVRGLPARQRRQVCVAVAREPARARDHRRFDARTLEALRNDPCCCPADLMFGLDATRQEIAYSLRRLELRELAVRLVGTGKGPSRWRVAELGRTR